MPPLPQLASTRLTATALIYHASLTLPDMTDRTMTALRCLNGTGLASTCLDMPSTTDVLNAARKLRCRFELVPEPCHAVSESLRGFVSDASSTHFDQAFQAVFQVS